MSELNGTVAVVTGAGRGIGREIALHQAQGGAKVGVLARTASINAVTVLVSAGPWVMEATPSRPVVRL